MQYAANKMTSEGFIKTQFLMRFLKKQDYNNVLTLLAYIC